jgi:hypothetical protein
MPTKTFVDLMTVFASQLECKGLREEMEWALIKMRDMIEADKLALPRSVSAP